MAIEPHFDRLGRQNGATFTGEDAERINRALMPSPETVAHIEMLEGQ